MVSLWAVKNPTEEIHYSILLFVLNRSKRSESANGIPNGFRMYVIIYEFWLSYRWTSIGFCWSFVWLAVITDIYAIYSMVEYRPLRCHATSNPWQVHQSHTRLNGSDFWLWPYLLHAPSVPNGVRITVWSHLPYGVEFIRFGVWKSTVYTTRWCHVLPSRLLCFYSHPNHSNYSDHKFANR